MPFKELDITLRCIQERTKELNDKLDTFKTWLLEFNLNILKPSFYVMHQQL
jgi:hypothetical protein